MTTIPELQAAFTAEAAKVTPLIKTSFPYLPGTVATDAEVLDLVTRYNATFVALQACWPSPNLTEIGRVRAAGAVMVARSRLGKLVGVAIVDPRQHPTEAIIRTEPTEPTLTLARRMQVMSTLGVPGLAALANLGYTNCTYLQMPKDYTMPNSLTFPLVRGEAGIDDQMTLAFAIAPMLAAMKQVLGV